MGSRKLSFVPEKEKAAVSPPPGETAALNVFHFCSLRSISSSSPPATHHTVSMGKGSEIVHHKFWIFESLTLSPALSLSMAIQCLEGASAACAAFSSAMTNGAGTITRLLPLSVTERICSSSVLLKAAY